MYQVLEMTGTHSSIVGEYEDICDAALVMEELLRDGLDVCIEYGGLRYGRQGERKIFSRVC